MLRDRLGLNIFFRYIQIIYRHRGLRKSQVFFFRTLLFYQSAIKWFRVLDIIAKKFGLEPAEVSRFTRLSLHSYLSRGLTVKERSNLLCYHYNAMMQNFDSEKLQKFFAYEPVIFSTLLAKNEKIYHFGITMFKFCIHEGGLTIFLSDNDKNILGSLTFNFGKKNDKTFLIIGGLQGGSIGKQAIVEATRNLRGLRPKQTLLNCLYEFASFFKIDYILGVSDENHLFFKKGKIMASYNDFWQEHGAVKIEGRNYLLPKELPERGFESVPQKKRKDWLLRKEYLRQIKGDILKFCQQ